MPSQLRIYTIDRGRMGEWVKGWTEGVYPLRAKHGFRIDGAWVIPEENQFVWILSYDGPESWEAKEKAYYDSEERKSLEPDPAQHIANVKKWFLTRVLDR